MFFNVSAGACRGGRTFWKAGAPCGDPVRLPFTGLVLASGRLVEAYCVGVALMALGPLIHTYIPIQYIHTYACASESCMRVRGHCTEDARSFPSAESPTLCTQLDPSCVPFRR